MQAVTIHVDERVYRDFKRMARRSKRSTSELIREAMARYREKARKPRRSIRDATHPALVGKIMVPWTSRKDLVDDFFDRE